MKKIPRTKLNCIGSLLKAASKFGVKVEIVDKKSNLMIFRKKKKNVFVRGHIPDLNSYVSSIVVNNKVSTKCILEKNNIPNPKGWVLKNLKKALNMVDSGEIKFPLVVKPIDGSQGYSVTVGIDNKEFFIKAIKEVFKYNRRQKGKPNSFLIEEYIPGDDYRILVLDGKVLTTLLRKPAYVVGDGVKTIKELVDEYNSQPGVGKDQPLCPIVRDYEFERNLSEKKLTESNKILKGKRVYLRRNANISTGGRSFECDSKVNPKYKKLAIKLANIFKIRFCAVDLIAADISKYKKFSIIELNETPGFDIHEVPYRGKPFPVAEHLIRAMFK
jgi:glutamate--cysteine ligase